jgi:hypothetical protein
MKTKELRTADYRANVYFHVKAISRQLKLTLLAFQKAEETLDLEMQGRIANGLSSRQLVELPARLLALRGGRSLNDETI